MWVLASDTCSLKKINGAIPQEYGLRTHGIKRQSVQNGNLQKYLGIAQKLLPHKIYMSHLEGHVGEQVWESVREVHTLG